MAPVAPSFVASVTSKAKENRVFTAIVVALVVFILWKYCTCNNPFPSVRGMICRPAEDEETA